MTAPLLRRAGETDVDGIVQLEEAAFGDPWPRSAIEHEIANPASLVLLARELENDGSALGYISFRQFGDEAEMLRLAVAPAARRRGLARALVQAGLARLTAVGVERCFLEVRSDNDPALGCYLSLGFAEVGRRPGYYRDGTEARVLARLLRI